MQTERLLITAISFMLIASCKGCPVYLTISLNGKSVEDSLLEINWGPDCRDKPDWIGVFLDDPSVSNSQPEAKINDLRNSSGKFLTNVKIGILRFPSGWNHYDENVLPLEYPKGKCLPYYIASFKGNELLAVECLKIQPNWMGKLNYVSEIPLKDLFIPGSHASGAYYSNITRTKSSLIKDFALTQNLDVWSQLVFGIRFLDFSIGYQAVERNHPNIVDKFWIVNENMFVFQLAPILRDVKRFVELSQEVVILDFSSFPIGFYQHPERHSDLLQLIKEEVGDIAYRHNTDEHQDCYQLSMDDIRKSGKYLLILYPLEELPHSDNKYDILCPKWKSFTMGYMNTSEALDFMRLLFTKKASSPVHDEGWIFHAVKGLEQSLNTNEKLQTTKERATIINPKISTWLGGPWSLTANIVALDYFINTNIIDIAIYANLHKAFTICNKNLTNFEIAF